MSLGRLLALCLLPACLVGENWVWPTTMPRPAGKALETFVQPTASGKIESALFGMTRNDGTRFHEGLDIRPLARDGRGEAVDLVKAVLAGRVAYVCAAPTGSYGRYVVLEHVTSGLPAYSLYAHLASVRGDLFVGMGVKAGQILGVLGRSSGDEPIPRERAHLHFEIGLRLSESYGSWHGRQVAQRRERNPHGNYHGWNLAGIDPLPLLLGQQSDLLDVIRDTPTALVVAVRTRKVPDFVQRHSGLVVGSAANAAGWKVEFTWHGLPKRWTPLLLTDAQLPASNWRILDVKESERNRLERRDMLVKGTGAPGAVLRRNLELAIGY